VGGTIAGRAAGITRFPELSSYHRASKYKYPSPFQPSRLFSFHHNSTRSRSKLNTTNQKYTQSPSKQHTNTIIMNDCNCAKCSGCESCESCSCCTVCSPISLLLGTRFTDNVANLFLALNHSPQSHPLHSLLHIIDEPPKSMTTLLVDYEVGRKSPCMNQSAFS
jgi:hypothetical protein